MALVVKVKRSRRVFGYDVYLGDSVIASGFGSYCQFNSQKKMFLCDSANFYDVDRIETELEPYRVTENGWQFYC